MDALIVTFNSERELAGLAACSAVMMGFDRTIIVDNCSTDQTCAIARAAGMVVVEQDRNAGFGRAANIGALYTRGAHFAVLNPDIRFTSSDDPDRLANHFEGTDVGLVGPRLVLPDGTAQDSARAIPSPANLLLRRLTRREHGAVNADLVCNVPWVVGGCVVIRRAAFDAVGGFDPRYFLYFEDVDLCLRLWEGGWTVRFDPSILVRHEHRAASRGRLWSPAARRHITSAVRFFLSHPRYLAPRKHFLPRPSGRIQ